MRAIGLAIVALALFAPSASAAVIEIDDVFCGCDGSSGDEDTHTIIVRAEPGELNRISVHQEPGGVVIEDLGAPLTGSCEALSSGTRICRDSYTGIAVRLGDGDDEVSLRDLGGSVDGGPGDDGIVVAGPPSQLEGGAGADLLDARLAPGSAISYRDHTAGVTVRLNGLADDGSPGEGDNVLGSLGSIEGGSGGDTLESGADAASLAGGAGNDTLVGSPEGESLLGQDGDDQIAGGGGNDSLAGGAGTDLLSGGPGHDEASYAGSVTPLRLSIGDGPNDGAAGEGDDIQADVEDLIGGSGADVMIGTAEANRLVGLGGADRMFGGNGADRLEGANDGDRLDAGPGPDSVIAGARDRLLLDDGERDTADCRSSAPVIEADSLDTFRRCAPWARLRVLGRSRARRLALRVRVICPRLSAVPCRGHFFARMSSAHGSPRRLSRTVRFGPIRPGRRAILTVRLSRASDFAFNPHVIGVSVRRGDGRSTTRIFTGF
jgi:RTX calcium-binding nonapeptide repeat (4 copies)